MNNFITDDHLQTLSDLSLKDLDTRCSWLRHVLFVVSTLFGILIALPNTAQYNLYARLRITYNYNLMMQR